MSENPLKILLVEDNAGDARLMRILLADTGSLRFELTHLTRMNEALNHISKGGVDMILLDLGLPDAVGMDAVRKAHAAGPNIPLVVLTALNDETAATQALKEGAQDYLIKGQIESQGLLRAIRYAIERQRMQAETEEIRKLQLQLKDEFLSHVSHELRSPLTAIYQFVTILLDNLAGELNPEQAEYLQIALRNVRQLESMIADLLEVTRIQEGKLRVELQCASLDDAVTDTFNMLQASAAAKGIALSKDVPAETPLAYVDPSRVRQVLVNLVSNAIKFTPRDGAVTLRVRSFEPDPTFLLVEVADTGCGIAPESVGRIFDRLYQVSDTGETARRGLGLGLHISKELVAQHGGKIWVSTQPQHGSIFSFTVPAFPLASLIGEIVNGRKNTDEPAAVLVAEMCSPVGWLSNKMRKEVSHAARKLLQECLLPLDVLLPEMGSSNARELFFIVTFTNSVGAASLAKRIGERFACSKQIQEADLRFSVTYTMLEKAESGLDLAIKDVTSHVSVKVQELVNRLTLSRSDRHEQQENSYCR